MNSLQAIYQLLAALTVIVTVGFLLSFNSARNGVRLRIALVLGTTAWSVAYLMEIYTPSLEWKVFWTAAKLPFIGIAVVAWLIFAVRACGFRRIASPLVAFLLLIIPMAAQPVIWTNDAHGWFWENLTLVQTDWGVLLDKQYGPVFWVYYLYCFGLSLFGMVCMLLILSSDNELSRTKRLIITIALLVPVLANIVFLMRLGATPHVSLLPFASLISSLAITLSFSDHLFDKVLVDLRMVRSDNQYWLALKAARADTFYWDEHLDAYIVDDRELNLFSKDGDRLTLTYRDILERIHPDDVASVDAAYRSSLKSGDYVEICGRVMGLDGEPRDIQLQAKLDRDGQRRVVRVSGLLVDISERRKAENAVLAEKLHAEVLNDSLQREIDARKRTEKKLKSHERELEALVRQRTKSFAESKERIRLLMNSTAEAIIGFSDAGVCRFCNLSALELLGYNSDSDVLGKSPEELGFRFTCDLDESLDYNTCIDRALRKGEATHSKNATLWRHDGCSVPVEFWVRPINRETHMSGAVVTFHNISDRLEAEKAAREIMAKSVAYLEASTAAIILLDCEGKIGYMNKSAGDLLDCEPIDMLGADWLDSFVPSVHADKARQDLERRISGEHVEDDGDLEQLRTKLGNIRYVRCQVTELQDSNGNIDGLVYSIEDRTGLREVESQLEQAQKLKSLGQLTGGIAHDFNNLLQIVSGNAQLLQYEPSLGGNGQVKSILDATERGADLVHRLLAFARRQRLSPQRIDVVELVKNMVALLQGAFPKNIEIVCDVGDTPVWVKADPAQVENAVLNLAVNARDAMPEGGRLMISCDYVTVDDAAAMGNPNARAGRFAQLRVRDTGHGISKRAIDHIFEPFFTTKDFGEGSGLGLSTVYGFAVQSGGFVEALSEPEKGASISFYLPSVQPEGVQLRVVDSETVATG